MIRVGQAGAHLLDPLPAALRPLIQSLRSAQRHPTRPHQRLTLWRYLPHICGLHLLVSLLRRQAYAAIGLEHHSPSRQAGCGASKGSEGSGRQRPSSPPAVRSEEIAETMSPLLRLEEGLPLQGNCLPSVVLVILVLSFALSKPTRGPRSSLAVRRARTCRHGLPRTAPLPLSLSIAALLSCSGWSLHWRQQERRPAGGGLLALILASVLAALLLKLGMRPLKG